MSESHTYCTSRPRLIGIGGERLRGVEVQIALDWQAKPAAQALDFRNSHGAEFGTLHAEIAPIHWIT